MKLRAYIAALHAALFAILLTVSPADSGSMMLLGTGKIGTAAAYSGPGDVQAYTNWWGLRAYSLATVSTKAIRISSIGTPANQTDINTLANGMLDEAAITSFDTTNGSTGVKVVTIYDKVGTADMTQPTDSMRPVLTRNALNSSSAAFFNGTTQKLMAASPGIAQPFTVSTIAKRSSGFTSFSSAFSGDTNGIGQVGYVNAANTAFYYAGTVVSINSGSNPTDNAFHAINTAFNGAGSVYQVDSLTGTGNPGTTNLSINSYVMGQTGLDTNNLIGLVIEAGIISGTAISAGTASSLNTNMHAAYGAW